MITLVEYEIRKKIILQVVEEHHNMKPVIEDWVYWVECRNCGKRYKWNQLAWQARHKEKCH